MIRPGLAAIAVALLGIVASGASGQSAETVWEPAAGLTQIPLWPDGAKILPPEATKPETMGKGSNPVAGWPWTYAANVSRPTMTIYPPKGGNSGVAMMVFPGGGYQVLAMDLEGSEICDWVVAQRMTCILLKYRVPQSWRPASSRYERAPKVQLALQDAQRAMGLVRARAGALGIDPHKIGVIGFSAGGHLVAAISNAGARTYVPVDAADRQPSRPDFAIALYPGHLWSRQTGGLAPWITIRRDAPPTFLLHSYDDPVDDVRHSIVYAAALRRAGVSVELHLYAAGGHAFGIRRSIKEITRWPSLVGEWLFTIGINQRVN